MSFEINELRDANNFLNSLIDNLTSAIFVVDKNLEIQNFNDTFKNLFHKTEAKIIGELCGNALGCSFAVEEGKDCGRTSHCGQCILRKSLLQAFTEKIPVYKKLLKRVFYIGDKPLTKYFQFTTKYIYYNERELVLIIVDDITKLEQQKINLEKLNNLKNEFLGMAAHDLRNPISIVQMYSEFLLEEMNQNISDEQKQFIKTINESSEFMLSLLDDLLDISIIEAGKLVLAIRKENFLDCINKSVRLNRVIADKKNISIKIEISEKVPEQLEFDRIKIEQVMNNLISNAIKYSFENSEITVQVEKSDGSIITKVKDQGVGIPERDISRIFKEFQKSSVKTTSGEKSTGLGLAIVKKIIKGHNGRVGVESKVEEGSTFYFTLPV